jgi:hypothetical protein
MMPTNETKTRRAEAQDGSPSPHRPPDMRSSAFAAGHPVLLAGGRAVGPEGKADLPAHPLPLDPMSGVVDARRVPERQVDASKP